MTADQIIARLREHANPVNVEGLARFGINPDMAFGVSAPEVRAIAKEAGTDHALARELWKTGYREARHVATLTDDPARVTEAQAERWVRQLDSWDICDGFCNNLMRRTPFAHEKAVEWSTRDEEFVKRAGFVMMAVLAVHDKKAADSVFTRYLRIVARESTDERHYVSKAVNWALRQIGKRNPALNGKAIAAAEKIAGRDSRAARWVAADALRELRSEQVQARLNRV